MSLKVQTLRALSDFLDLASIPYDAFPKTDILHQLIYAAGRPSATKLLQSAEKDHQRSKTDSSRRYVKCVDDDTEAVNQSIAWAIYSVHEPTPERTEAIRKPPQVSLEPVDQTDLSAKVDDPQSARAINSIERCMQRMKERNLK